MQIQVNQEVVDILTGIIKDSKGIWSTLSSVNNTYEDFMNLPIPKEDVPLVDSSANIHNILSNKYISELQRAAILLEANKCTNAIVYRAGGIMDWHTNSNVVGTRMYYTFTMDDGYFRYINPKTGEEFLDKDNIGWTAREFKIEKESPLWHCIWTRKIRFSFGFNK